MSNQLFIIPEVDTSVATRQTKEWVQQSVSDFEKAASGSNKVQSGLDGIAKASEKTASAVDKINLRQTFEKAVGSIGAVKDILEKTGGSLLGFSDSTQKAVKSTLELGEKGAQLGAMFGPIGLGIGALAGGIAGYFVAANQALEDSVNNLREARNESVKVLDTFKDVERIDMSSFVSQLEDVRKKEEAIKNEIIQQNKERREGGFVSLDVYVPDFSDTNKRVEFLSKAKQKSIDEENQLQEAIKNTSEVLAEKGIKENEAYKLAEKAAVKTQNALRDLRLEANTLEQTPEALKDFGERFQSAIKNADKASDNLEKTTSKLTSTKSAARTAKKEVKDLGDSFKDLNLYLKGTGEGLDIVSSKIKTKLGKPIEVDFDLPSLNEIIGEATDQERFTSAFDVISDKLFRFTKLSQDSSNVIAGEMSKIGGSIAGAFATTATEGINQYLDVLAGAEKDVEKSGGKLARAMVRQIGTSLINDGIANILKGTGLSILGLPQGPALIGVGSAEVAAGTGMGAAAALRQKKKGDFADKSAPGGSGSSSPTSNSSLISGGSSTQNLRPIVLQFSSVVPATERDAQVIGDQLNKYLLASAKAGRN